LSPNRAQSTANGHGRRRITGGRREKDGNAAGMAAEVTTSERSLDISDLDRRWPPRPQIKSQTH
jgi:hypothetical protein